MNTAAFAGLIYNAALLLVLVVLYDTISLKTQSNKVLRQLLTGLMLGAIGIAVMVSHWHFVPGVVFDTRSILLSLAGLFFGVLPTAIAVIMTSIFRLYQGGVGAWTGVAVIVTSAGLGLAWSYFRRNWVTKEISALELLSFGIVVTVAMLLWMLTLPGPIAADVLSKISLPVMIIFPLATVLIGKLLVSKRMRKTIEDALQESEVRYRTLISKMLNGFALHEIICDETGQPINYRFLDINQAFETTTGLKATDLIGKTVLDVLSQTETYWIDTYGQVALTGQSAQFENYSGALDKYFEVLVYSPQKGQFATVFTDITKRKQATEESRKLSRAVEQSASTIMITDASGIIEFVNPAFSKTTGYNAEEVVGRNPRILKSGQQPQEFYKNLWDTITSGEVWEGELLNKKKNGELYWETASISPIRDEDNQPIHFVAVKEDITERKRTQEKLQAYAEQLEAMVSQRTQELENAQEKLVRKEKLATLGQLAGSVAHELRNPLGVLSNAIYFLKLTLDTANETTKEYLDIIASEISKSDKIVSDLLNFSRTRLAERIEKEDVQVSDLVAQALASQPPPKPIQVSTQIPPDLPPVFIDPQQIGQVLINLLANAYQAMPQGGELTINVAPKTKKVTLSVTDTGVGIPPENIDKLFEPLFTTKPKGIGLGLAVSKNLVEANAGDIEVKSEAGRGSTFIVSMPTREQAKISNQILPSATG